MAVMRRDDVKKSLKIQICQNGLHLEESFDLFDSNVPRHENPRKQSRTRARVAFGLLLSRVTPSQSLVSDSLLFSTPNGIRDHYRIQHHMSTVLLPPQLTTALDSIVS
jgi:hypothetical protein